MNDSLKSSLRHRNITLLSLSALMSILTLALTAQADVIDTTGTSFDLANSATWVGGNVPGSSDTANFKHAGSPTMYNAANGSSFNFGGMSFGVAGIQIGSTSPNAITINLGAGGLSGALGVTNIGRLGNSTDTVNVGANDQTWSIGSGNTLANIAGTATITLTSTAQQTWLRNTNSGFTGTWRVDGSTLLAGESVAEFGGTGVKIELINNGAIRLGHPGVTKTFSKGSIDLVGDGRILASNSTSQNLTASTSQAVTGAGNLTLGVWDSHVSYNSTLNLVGAYTHTGNTLVQGASFEAQPFTVNFTEDSSTTFTIGANGVNNAILDASGTSFNALTLDGTFVFDRSGASFAVGNAWTIVGSGFDSLLYGVNFKVAGFTEADGVWTDGDWSFSEDTGTLVVIPEPGSLVLLLIGGTVLVAGSRRRRT